MAFAPALAGSFHLDDYSLFVDPVITRPAGAWQVWALERVRPLSYFTLWLNYQLSGESPASYHFVNWLLHLASIVLCGRTLARLLPPPAALFATAVFALHPLQTEAVAYVFARSTLLCGLLCWAALYAWTLQRHWWAVALQALALLAKEEAVALPVVVALLDLQQHRRLAHLKPLAALFTLALVAGLRSLWAGAALAGSGVLTQSGVAPLDYLASQSLVLLRYAAQAAVPLGLNFDPDLPLLNDWRGWSLWLIWIAVAARSVKRFHPRGWWTLAALAFLAPTSSILPIADLSADRRVYLALAAAAAALPAMPRRATLTLAAVLALLSFNRSLTFRTEESLWRDTVAKSPGKARPRVQLARAVEPREALPLLDGFNDPLALAEKGRVLMELGRPAEALPAFGQVLAERPGDPAALTNRGTALAALGQTDAARADFVRALERDACFPPARANLRRLGVALDAHPCAAELEGRR